MSALAENKQPVNLAPGRRPHGPGGPHGPHGMGMPVEKPKNVKATLKRIISYVSEALYKFIRLSDPCGAADFFVCRFSASPTNILLYCFDPDTYVHDDDWNDVSDGHTCVGFRKAYRGGT